MLQTHAARRERVKEALAGAVLVVPSTPTAVRNNDVEHDYRQDSDLYYLTGFDEPESVLVLRGGSAKAFTLFLRPRDPEREVWDGRRAGVQGALDDFGADQAFAIDELAAQLPGLLENTERVFYRLGKNRAFDEQLLAALDRVRARHKLGVSAPHSIVDPALLLHELRLKKDVDELALMQRAADITGEAHLAAMARAKPGLYEYEIDALIGSIFRKHGSERPAYGSIVGSGPNATVLHYRKNDRQLAEGDLLLIDAGCEFGYYASDVTRTFPVSGRFSDAQRAVYEVVLEAQLASIAAVRPGATLDAVHQASVDVLAAGLVRLGLIAGPVDDAIAEGRYKRFYMHRTSHWLGMDVHDVGAYFQGGRARLLEPGMVLTVEPGLYIAENADVDARWRGIGVRIEDDVLVTRSGCSVLTQNIPKTVADVERACSA